MNWTRAHSLGAGLGLILLVNAIALGGVYFNRAGEPDSRLLLSERELWPAYQSEREENSGVALHLNWRLATAEEDPHGFDRQPLSLEQMHELGFQVPESFDADQAIQSFQRQLPREVLVVLELDGPAHRREVQLRQAEVDKRHQQQKRQPQDKELQEKLKKARDSLADEKQHASRLFAIDVGLDRQALRQRYPDRQRYAIVRGKVRPWVEYRADRRIIGGQLQELSIEQINVPYRWRAQFAASPPGPYRNSAASDTRYQVEVRFGQRLEPWISAVPQFGE